MICSSAAHQANYVDLTKVAIPQADEQQRLLANLIGFMNADRKPLPRFWYFPARAKAVVVMTGDDHAQQRHRRAIRHLQRRQRARLQRGRLGVRARHVVHLPEHADHARAGRRYTAQGFEIGVHMWMSGCARLRLLQRLHAGVDRGRLLAAAQPRSRRVPGAADPDQPHALHRVERLRHAAAGRSPHGIRFDTNYYYWPGDWVNDVPGLFTGSGMPMRFAKADGTMIDVYQATTQMTDESGQTLSVHGRHAARPGAWPRRLLRRVRRQHAHRLARPRQARTRSWLRRRRAACRSFRPKQMLDWIDGRNASTVRCNHRGTGRRSASPSRQERAPMGCRRCCRRSGRTGVAREPDQGRRAGQLLDSADQGRQLRDVLVARARIMLNTGRQHSRP